MIWEYFSAIIISYLIGSIPSGLLIGRIVGKVDIREYGSGKIGFTNSLRTLGWRPSLAVLVLDAAKGYGPVMVTWAITGDHGVQVAAGLAAIIGHNWPALAGFRGGRGVATTFGVFLGLNAPTALVLIAVAVALIYVFRFISLVSIVIIPLATLAFLSLTWAGYGPYTYPVFGACASLLIILQHRENIKRLLAGTEPRIGHGGQMRPAISPESDG